MFKLLLLCFKVQVLDKLVKTEQGKEVAVYIV